MKKLKLTVFGEFVRRHMVATSADWWVDLRNEVERYADEGGDWESLVEERIQGLQEFKNRYYEFRNS